MDRPNIINPSTQSNPHHTTATATPAFHHPNGFPPSLTATRAPSADIEMVSFNGTAYISLRDLLPSSYPAPIAFPRPPSHDSAAWCEILIKNPLVKHAAIAYLQPMSSSTLAEAEGKGILGAIMDRCRCGCDVEDENEGCCLLWLGDVISRTARRAGIGRDRPNDNDHKEEDEDEENCELVD